LQTIARRGVRVRRSDQQRRMDALPRSGSESSVDCWCRLVVTAIRNEDSRCSTPRPTTSSDSVRVTQSRTGEGRVLEGTLDQLSDACSGRDSAGIGASTQETADIIYPIAIYYAVKPNPARKKSSVHAGNQGASVASQRPELKLVFSPPPCAPRKTCRTGNRSRRQPYRSRV